MAGETTHHGFLLLRQWRDERDGLTLQFWVATDGAPFHITITGQEAVMFLDRGWEAKAPRRVELPLRSMDGSPVDALYYRTQRELLDAREALRRAGMYPCEADVKPAERFLMERFVTGGLAVTGAFQERSGVRYFRNPRVTASDYEPRLSVLSLDIETDGFEGALLSIAGVTQKEERVFIVQQRGAVASSAIASSSSLPGLSFHENEAAALRAFVHWVREVDPDLLIGWNVVDFDLRYLEKLAGRVGVLLALGRAGGRAEVLPPQGKNQPSVARVPGRVVLDGIATLRNATIHFESYALDDVAREMLGRGKDIQSTPSSVDEIRRMAREEPEALARYNLEDCRLVLDIFERARLVDFAVERQRLTGLALDRQGGSVAAFDQLYLPRLHGAGFVAPSVGDQEGEHGSPGGYVMNSVPGLFRNVIVLDFKSLYPSIIRTFLVDPLGLAQPGEDSVPGFDGGTFAREGHILPELIRSMWAARDTAKKEKNAALSQAIKIMMNSFYGVLGTPGCRFFDHRLVSSITRRGHEVLTATRTEIERKGLEVIYGDTDSVFVHLPEELRDEECDTIGRQLAADLTAYFYKHWGETLRIESHLELEYETHFRRFLMPTMRGSEVGTKKRYAGSILNQQGEVEVVFKGLEAVRTDWTPLARNFQRELFHRVFSDEPYEALVRGVADDLLAGKLDSQLVYTKRLRRGLEEYVKNVPPHVQAARKLKSPGRNIQYVITVNGPEPVSGVGSALDYGHYLERQLRPAADSLLNFLGTSFDELADRQLPLF